jgi:hypothetical protein
MKVGNYELSPETLFYVVVDDEIPITINAGGDIPLCAIWINGKPKPYELPKGGFILSSNFEEFKSLLTLE